MSKEVLTVVKWNQVTLGDGFWGKRAATNRRVTLPIEYEQCKKTGRIDAFRLDWTLGQPRQPHVFWDSDVAKWVEAAAYSLATHPDRALQRQLDEVVNLIASAQQADGYLNVYFTVVHPEQRWTNLRDMHELYCAGHLMEAAVALHEALGDCRLLDVMSRYAEYIGSVFGRQPGQKRGYCGHEEIELALVKLHRATGSAAFLELAKYFVDQRGQQPHYFDEEAAARGDASKPWGGYAYYQADVPVREQKTANGHSVRALYLYSGMADVAAATADRSLQAACRRLWRNLVSKRMYLTGGIGSSAHGERFTFDYDLPNETAYAETCAAIALVLFAHRMLRLEARGEYADVMERALYNGVISGVSLSGDRFFYANPLAVSEAALQPGVPGHVAGGRQEWFGCACCPPNIARLLASVGSYLYSTSRGALFVHLYETSDARVIVDGATIKLCQTTRYPWDPNVLLSFSLEKPTKFTLALRIPGWCRSAKLRINGKAFALASHVQHGYVKLQRQWADGDRVQLVLPMPVERIYANPQCRNNAGKVAIQRGPIVYCAEEMDNDKPLSSLALPRWARLVAYDQPRLLGGAVVIKGVARKQERKNWGESLYRTRPSAVRKVPLMLVPYCLWGNRRENPMQVWLNES